MRIVSTPHIPSTYITWRSRRGELFHTVICKATYDLTPIESVLAQTHEPLNDVDQHWEDNELRSLRAASDLAPFKRRADVVVVGAAFAPSGTTARRVIARIAVGELDKAIATYGDRSVGRDGIVVEGRPFSRMPLMYERARGGDETPNPVGRTSARNNVGSLQLPNLQPVAFEPEAPDFYVPSIGFGPIAASWPSRSQRLGAHAALPPDALLERAEDFDPAYFNVAPLDQQLEELPSNAHLLLEGLHAEHQRLTTRLPGHRARALVDIAGIDLQLVCDTLWIDTERALCTLTWRGSFRAEGLVPEERIIVALEGADMRRSADVLRKAVPSGEETLTLKPRKTMAMAEHAVLPFGNQAAAATPFTNGNSGTPFQSGPPSVRDPSEAPPSRPPSSQALRAQPQPTSQSQTQPQPQVQAPVPPPPALAPPPPLRISQPAIFPSSPPLTESLQAPAYLSSPRGPIQARGPVAHDPRAATGGVASASNAAARSNQEAPTNGATHEVPIEKAVAKRPRTFVDLLWFISDAVDKIRTQPAWAEQLKGSAKGSPWLTEAASSEAARAELSPQTYVARAMTRMRPLDGAGVQQAILNAVDEDGFLVRPLVVVEGDLGLFYSPLEALRSTIALAEPLGATDKKLRGELDLANEIAKPERRSTASTIEATLARLRSAFQAVNRSYPPNYLEATTERALIEDRLYQRRVVLGGPKLIASLSQSNGPPLQLYLPDELADRLPLLARFRARLIAEPHARQESSEGEGTVLVALALGRVVGSS